jgi:hypothetical protein
MGQNATNQSPEVVANFGATVINFASLPYY